MHGTSTRDTFPPSLSLPLAILFSFLSPSRSTPLIRRQRRERKKGRKASRRRRLCPSHCRKPKHETHVKTGFYCFSVVVSRTTQKECGLVKEGHRVDERAEWRSFEDDKGSKERAGGPANPLLDDGGIGNSMSIQLQPGMYHLARAQAMLKVCMFQVCHTFLHNHDSISP